MIQSDQFSVRLETVIFGLFIHL